MTTNGDNTPPVTTLIFDVDDTLVSSITTFVMYRIVRSSWRFPRRIESTPIPPFCDLRNLPEDGDIGSSVGCWCVMWCDSLVVLLLYVCLFFCHSFCQYDVGTGFTAHRNGDSAQDFMVQKLGFPNRAEAKVIRDSYFEKYHATAKALQVAEAEGKFPPLPAGVESKSPRFDPKDLAEYWATNLNFSLLGGKKKELLRDFQDCPLKLVAFSNGPRKYVKRVLVELGLWEVFGEDRLFAVDDVLPHCKPEKEAFQKIFDALNVSAKECVMIEDSMKNTRQAKGFGMRTILIAGKGRKRSSQLETAAESKSTTGADASELTKPGDAPVEDDPAVDVCLEVVEEMRSVLPGLWETPARFESAS